MADTDFLDDVHLGENRADDRDDCRSHVFERRRRLPLLGRRPVLEASRFGRADEIRGRFCCLSKGRKVHCVERVHSPLLSNVVHICDTNSDLRRFSKRLRLLTRGREPTGGERT